MSKAVNFFFNLIMRHKTCILFFFLIVDVCSKGNAQDISVKASAPKYDYLIGDKINVTLDFKRPVGFSYSWSRKDPEKGKLELADSLKIDSFNEGGLIHTIIHLPLEGFDSGNIVYPEQVFKFYKSGDTSRIIVKTQPLTFHIVTISVDTNKDIKPIAGPVSPRLNWLSVMGYAFLYLLILGVILMVVLLYIKDRKKKRLLLSQRPEIQRPPWEIAIESLLELRKTDLPGKGDVKGYYISLSSILRRFVSEIYMVDALELTTEEVIHALRNQFIKQSITDLLSVILNLADSVKFAKYLPNQSDHENAMESSISFVQNVRDSKMEGSQQP